MGLYKTLLIALLVGGMASTSAIAQSYYDDDIYYDSSKDTKKKVEDLKKEVKAVNSNASTSSQYQYVTASDGTVYIVDQQGNAYPVSAQNIPGSDLYTVNTGNMRDVDEYNRRYQGVDSISVDSLYRDPFANTRNIERFSNPTIVSGSDDQALIEYYETTQSAQIYIFADTPYYSPYYSPYSYWNSWRWNSWYYGYGWYSPYYSWAWGWDPYWDPYWGPGWGPSWYPGPHYPHHPHHPHPPVSPGAHRPHYPGGNMANHHSTGGYRGGGSGINNHSNGGHRGSATGRPSTVGNVSSLGDTRPSPNYNGGTRPSGSRYGSGNSGTRNSGVSSGGSRSGGRGSAINNNNSRSSSPSYSTPRSSGGSRGGFGGGGGRSGGGGGRGGRR